jgi:hypothetical protein
LEEGGVAFQGSQVVTIGSQAYVAVGADGEECVSFNSQLSGRSRFEAPKGVGDVGAGCEGHGGLKQGRVCYVFLQGSAESKCRRRVCTGSA